MSEEWRTIKGFEDYKVSNLGRVVSLKGKKERFLKPFPVGAGYYSVNLFKDNKRNPKYVHRLVAEAFIVNPCRFPEINHKDEDKSNNELSNLEWCDRTYNNAYGTTMERRRKSGSKPVNQYDLQGNLIKMWSSAYECRKELGFNGDSIAKCCKGERELAHGYKWSYVQ